MKNFFSSNLKYIRESKNMSKTDLAKILNVHQSTISRWENDEMGATIDNAIDVSEALNIPLPELLGKDLRLEYNNDESDEEKNLKKYAIENGAELIINKTESLSAEDALKIQNEVQKILMEEVSNNKKTSS